MRLERGSSAEDVFVLPGQYWPAGHTPFATLRGKIPKTRRSGDPPQSPLSQQQSGLSFSGFRSDFHPKFGRSRPSFAPIACVFSSLLNGKLACVKQKPQRSGIAPLGVFRRPPIFGTYFRARHDRRCTCAVPVAGICRSKLSTAHSTASLKEELVTNPDAYRGGGGGGFARTVSKPRRFVWKCLRFC